jgi:hypothetical protein
MSETIWRATDADGKCYEYHDDKPIWDGRYVRCRQIWRQLEPLPRSEPTPSRRVLGDDVDAEG